jgi:hypothetical protein
MLACIDSASELQDDDEVSIAVKSEPEQLFAGKTEQKPSLLSFGRDAFVGKNSADEKKRAEKEKARSVLSSFGASRQH